MRSIFLFLFLLFVINPASGEEMENTIKRKTTLKSDFQIQNCLNFLNDKIALKILERNQLKTFSQFVRLNKNRLEFKVGKNSFSYKKANSGDDTDYFLNYFPEVRMFLVLHVYLEGWAFTLFSEKGEKWNLGNYPIFSPDKIRILDLNGDLVAQYTPNVIQIFRVENGKLCLEFKTFPEAWEPSNGNWINNDLISFEKTLDGKILKKNKGKLVYDNLERKWILEE